MMGDVVTGAEACRRAWQFLRKGGSSVGHNPALAVLCEPKPMAPLGHGLVGELAVTSSMEQPEW